MKEQEFKNLLKKSIDKKTSIEEEKTLKKFDDTLISKNSGNVFSSILHKKQLKKEIEDGVFSKKKVNIKWVGIAASILFCVSLVGFYHFFNATDKSQSVYLYASTQIGEKRIVILPDGSTVKLNSKSSLKYPNEFSKNKRIVQLEGEAFFDVKKDPNKPFVVKTGNIKTKVLGTSFNVKAFTEEENLQVTLVTGKVQVQSNKKNIFLEPSQQVTYLKTSNTFSKKTVDVINYTDWRNNVLHFNNETIAEVALKLQRWYKVSIETQLKKEDLIRISASYKANESLDNIIKSIVFLNDELTYKWINNKKLIIKNKTMNKKIN